MVAKSVTLGVLLATGSACTRSDRVAVPPPVASAKPFALPSPEETVEVQATTSTDPAATKGLAYDLAADRELRARAAREELGANTRTSVVSDIFVVFSPPGFQGPGLTQSVRLMHRAMDAYMNQRFGRKPEKAISVYLFPDASSYEGFCRKKYSSPCIAHYGFYQPEDRSMVMNIGLGLGTLTHELVHPLVEADFPDAPTWLNEGIASVFEAPVIPPRSREIHGVKNWRHPRLKSAIQNAKEREHARLDVLFGMSDEVFRGDGEDLHYAMGRYACQWLDERGELWPFYQRWRDTVATDPTGTKAFEAIVGMTPAAANAIWTKWALAL